MCGKSDNTDAAALDRKLKVFNKMVENGYLETYEVFLDTFKCAGIETCNNPCKSGKSVIETVASYGVALGANGPAVAG